MIFRPNASFLATAACIAVGFHGDRISAKRMAGYRADAFLPFSVFGKCMRLAKVDILTFERRRACM